MLKDTSTELSFGGNGASPACHSFTGVTGEEKKKPPSGSERAEDEHENPQFVTS